MFAPVLSGMLALILISLVTLVVVGAVKAARAVNAKAESIALKTRAYTHPGAQGRIASVRLRLRSSIEGTREALDAAIAQDAQVGESMALLKRLTEHAADLDGQLRVLERESEPERISAKLPELRERAERIMHAAEELRWAVQDRQHRFSDDDLSRLSDECTQEADALRHWDRTRAQTADDAAAGPFAGPDPKRLAAGRWPTADEVLGFVDRIRRPSGETNAR